MRLTGVLRGDLGSARAAAPWHLWVVAAFFLFVYAIGAYDYVQVQARSDSYYAAQGYGPAQIEYFTDYSFVPLALWTVNIVSGLAAVILLVLRSRWATVTAAAAAVSVLVLQVITFGFMDRWNILGPRLSIVDIGVLVLTCGLWLYCHCLRGKNVLT